MSENGVGSGRSAPGAGSVWTEKVGASRPRTMPPGPVAERSWASGCRKGRSCRDGRLASNDEVPKVVPMAATVRWTGGSVAQSRRAGDGGAGSGRPGVGSGARFWRRDHTGLIRRSIVAG